MRDLKTFRARWTFVIFHTIHITRKIRIIIIGTGV